MLSLSTENSGRPSKLKPSSSIYASLFKRRKGKKDAAAPAFLSQHSVDKPSTSADGSRQESIVTARSRHRIRRDIQSHIPDWIDDVAHAHLIEIAERLREHEQSLEEEACPSESLGNTTSEDKTRPTRVPTEVNQRAESGDGGQMTARSSVSRASFALPTLSFDAGDRDLVSPLGFTESSAIFSLESWLPPEVSSDVHERQFPHFSSASGSTERSRGSALSQYSQESSMTSPSIYEESTLPTNLGHHMTWKNIAADRHSQSTIETVTQHQRCRSTNYSILDPVREGVFDAQSLHTVRPSVSYCPAAAGVFDDPADFNKPLPPEPSLPSRVQSHTFFVVREPVHSPLFPSPTQRHQTLHPSDLMSTGQSWRLSGPFADPFLYDAMLQDMDISDTDGSINASSQSGDDTNGAVIELPAAVPIELPAMVPMELPAIEISFEETNSSPDSMDCASEPSISQVSADVPEQFSHDESTDESTESEDSRFLAQAENDLLALLCLDTVPKFRRQSWLADSPTHGKVVAQADTTNDVRPSSAPTGTGDAAIMADTTARITTHYEFVWTPEGWQAA